MSVEDLRGQDCWAGISVDWSLLRQGDAILVMTGRVNVMQHDQNRHSYVCQAKTNDEIYEFGVS